MAMTGWHNLSLLLHLGALALWLGGNVFFLVVFVPAARQLRPGAGVRTLNRGRIAFEAVSWAAIGLLAITGIINLLPDDRATGALRGDVYALALAFKLFLFGAMLMHQGLQVFKYAPKIAALTAQTPADAAAWPTPLTALWQKWFTLLKIKATLGPVAVWLGLALAKGW